MTSQATNLGQEIDGRHAIPFHQRIGSNDALRCGSAALIEPMAACKINPLEICKAIWAAASIAVVCFKAETWAVKFTLKNLGPTMAKHSL